MQCRERILSLCFTQYEIYEPWDYHCARLLKEYFIILFSCVYCTWSICMCDYFSTFPWMIKTIENVFTHYYVYKGSPRAIVETFNGKFSSVEHKRICRYVLYWCYFTILYKSFSLSWHIKWKHSLCVYLYVMLSGSRHKLSILLYARSAITLMLYDFFPLSSLLEI